VGVLALADRRVITGDFLDSLAAQLVQPGVPYVTNDRAFIVDDHDRKDARHAVPLRPQTGDAMDFVVRDLDGLAHDQPALTRSAAS
jgi:hypothetical protein